MAAGRAEGLDIGPERAIAWITSNPARVLGLEDSIGRIAEGYNADVVLWSGNPFSIYSKADQVYIDGVLRIDRANCKRSHRLNLDVDHAESGVCQ
jgi:imidazolonepropionase-like amidohydrolase